MKTKKLSELTLEELQAKKKTLKGAIIGLGIVMVVAVATLVYLAIKTGNFVLIAGAMGCGITLLPSIIMVNQMNNEIKSRTKINNEPV
ncbi:hypothetical protein VB796_18410 [Arcicella sp. LKC2W]|uniref:hypothetical protein n=1 Tax=Arcicella sp. LKC2W TaxID=2984198 RepID=UPI002B21C229|nr:hypothetical protein [Arcicella sp. LKC2W]MEA5461041.1 hypothetical protein [Arcicella sp. LKC2W]